eukprot:Phypoly_transcript_11495.p1 GENE.Phypoly_transcript_11495~~Phypoly_transcript_11495.p1  ORF type:complete len:354 (+),score=48.42 Phypoly_transcript_11495:120-1181(+)
MSIPFFTAAQQIRNHISYFRHSHYFIPGTVIAVAIVVTEIGYIRWKIIGPKCTDTADLTNKVVIVTGASGGIGEATAKILANMNAHVVLACRSEEKTKAAIERIRKQTQKGKITYLPLDLGDFDSVRDFASEFAELGLPLHVLILNAGVVYAPYSKTKSGFESHFGTNHLGHFLLTNLLLNKLIAAQGRVVAVTSGLYHYGRINFEDINYEKSPYSPSNAYATSKLANILFANELQNRVKGTGVDVFSVAPGLVKTDASRNHKGLGKILLNIVYFLIGKTPEQGAQTIIKAAISPSLTGHGGAYLDNCKEVPLSKLAQDPVAATKLWDVSSKMVGLTRDFLARQPSQKMLRNY